MSEKPETVRYTVLSPKASWAVAAVIGLLGIGVAVWLLLAYGDGDAARRNQLEAIKTAAIVMLGVSGGGAVLLAARRGRAAEIALKQQESSQELAVRSHALREREAEDATLRRIGELYTQAVDQLGSDKLPVRLGGLHALERLGRAHGELRQVVVELICACLRTATDPAGDVDADRDRVQEHRVRQAAQAILVAHLRPGPAFWPDLDLDLTGASLLDFDLRECQMRSATFTGATFVGGAWFGGVRFTGHAHFGSATFCAQADFSRAVFHGAAVFDAATFTGDAIFSGAVFAEAPRFEGALLAAQVRLEGALSGTGRGTQPVPFDRLPLETVQALRSLPAEVPYATIAGPGPRRLVPVGVAAKSSETVCLDFDADPHFMAFFGRYSGKTNLLRVIMRGIEDRYTREEAVIVLADYRGLMYGFVTDERLPGYGRTEQMLRGMIRDVAGSMRSRIPGRGVTQEQLENRSWWKGPEVFVVVDDYQFVSTHGENPLNMLREFLPMAQQVGLHLIIAGTPNTGGEGAGDPVLDDLRALHTPALVGNGSPADGPVVRRVGPLSLPPGRAQLADRKGHRLVQVGWLDPEQSARS